MFGKYKVATEPEPWECKKCTYFNYKHSYRCEACGLFPDNSITINFDKKSRKENKYFKTFKIFEKTKILMPVIYIRNYEQTIKNMEIIKRNDIKYVWLKGTYCEDKIFIEIFKIVRKKYPEIFIGLNFSSPNMKNTFNYLNNLIISETRPNALWIDESRIDDTISQKSAAEIQNFIHKINFKDLYFGGILIKNKYNKDSLEKITENASKYVDVITTSVEAKEKKTEIEKLIRIYDLNKKFDIDLKCFVAVETDVTLKDINEFINYCNIIIIGPSIYDEDKIFKEEELVNLKKTIEK